MNPNTPNRIKSFDAVAHMEERTHKVPKSAIQVVPSRTQLDPFMRLVEHLTALRAS